MYACRRVHGRARCNWPPDSVESQSSFQLIVMLVGCPNDSADPIRGNLVQRRNANCACLAIRIPCPCPRLLIHQAVDLPPASSLTTDFHSRKCRFTRSIFPLPTYTGHAYLSLFLSPSVLLSFGKRLLLVRTDDRRRNKFNEFGVLFQPLSKSHTPSPLIRAGHWTPASANLPGHSRIDAHFDARCSNSGSDVSRKRFQWISPMGSPSYRYDAYTIFTRLISLIETNLCPWKYHYETHKNRDIALLELEGDRKLRFF